MKIPKIGKDGNSKFVELDAVEEVQAETSPAEIDAKRATHSLERASQLAERGDFAGAILATRQAIALKHDSSEAHGMLGQFLERSGDLKNAALSYAKALEISPNSTLDRASLERVQERLKESSNIESFSFNDSELTDYSAETTPFDSGLADGVPIMAKLPPTRAELEALSAAEAAGKTEVEAPIVSDASPVVSDAELPVAAVLPPTTAEPAGITASLPPTSVGVIADVMAARLGSTPVATPAPSMQGDVFASPKQVLDRRETGDRRKLNVPVQIERRTQDDRRAAKLGTAPSPFVFQPVFDEPKAPVWAQFLRQPSFFGRTLPLVVLAVFSLGFLTWARDRAVARSASTPTTLANNADVVLSDPAVPTDPVVTTPRTQTGAPQTAPQANAANPNDGFSISNNPVTPSQAAPATGANAGTANPAPATNNAPAPNAGSAGANNRPATAPRGNTPRSTTPRNRPPQFPVASLQPAPIPSENIRDPRTIPTRRGNGGGNGGVVLPQPEIDQRPVEAPVRVLPSGPDPSSVAPPLNPAGSANNGYIRIRSGSLGAASAPQRPQNQANANEQAAANAARGGQTDQAIQGLTSAINSNPSDAGFRFQQRANLFLERGDYARAADDFQSAISAYQDQINRGENVSSARSGLRSARSGLNLALASRRNGN